MYRLLDNTFAKFREMVIYCVKGTLVHDLVNTIDCLPVMSLDV